MQYCMTPWLVPTLLHAYPDRCNAPTACCHQLTSTPSGRGAPIGWRRSARCGSRRGRTRPDAWWRAAATLPHTQRTSPLAKHAVQSSPVHRFTPPW
eukprot:2800294-Pyramimonas_sp.AAC.2